MEKTTEFVQSAESGHSMAISKTLQGFEAAETAARGGMVDFFVADTELLVVIHRNICSATLRFEQLRDLLVDMEWRQRQTLIDEACIAHEFLFDQLEAVSKLCAALRRGNRIALGRTCIALDVDV